MMPENNIDESPEKIGLVARFLTGIAFVLAIGTAVVLGAHVWTLMTPVPGEKNDTINEESSFRDFAHNALSKLPLLPSSKKERQLVGVMVENHQDARPHQIGLERALLVEEFFVEGYISRFLAIFDADALPKNIGPVRSLRPYFVDGGVPWVRTFFHAGGSPEALERVKEDDLVRNFNGLGLPNYFTRDDSIAAPHNLFLAGKSILDLLSSTDIHPTLWPPYKTGRNPSDASADNIFINFYSPVHDVRYTYSDWTGTYTRLNGRITAESHPSNVLVLEIPVESVGEYGRLVIPVVGRGRALLFRSGTVQEGAWSKSDANSAFVFTQKDGEPFVFSQGQTWMTVVSYLERVEWDNGTTESEEAES